jgi:hypothetical protein
MMAQVEPTAHFKPEQRGYEEGKTAGMRKRQLKKTGSSLIRLNY